VYDANDKMAEKLSRIITEKEIARHRRLRQQISSVKELVFQLMDEPKVDAGLTTSGAAEIKMSMERKLTLMPKQAPPIVKQPSNASEKVADLERFNRMLNLAHIDKKKLWGQVEEVLEKQQTATLREIIDTVGLEHGVGEVVTYFSFLKEKSSRVQAMPEITELIPLDKAQTSFIEVPYLLFSR
jgi:replication initiation and membrane attachment protein DnaB